MQGNRAIFSALMNKRGGKAKTRKSVSKRFKITGTGKVLRRRQGKRHLLITKNRKRKRSLGKAVLVSDADIPMIRKSMPFS